MLRNNRGFTLLEATIALSVFIVLLAFSLTAMINIAHLTGKMAVRQELTENARFAIDAITIGVRMADTVYIDKNSDGTFSKLTVKNVSGTNLYFEYNISAAYHHMILQGSNELARYIGKCDISIDDGILRIRIETDTAIANNSNRIPAPLIFVRDIDLRYKE